MIKQLAVPLSAILIIGMGFNYHARVQSTTPETTPAVTVLTFHGKNVDGDTGRKLVTLEGPQGRGVPVWVRNPNNLKATKVAGGPICVDCHRSDGRGEQGAGAIASHHARQLPERFDYSWPVS